jgi:hypothetical protein
MSDVAAPREQQLHRWKRESQTIVVDVLRHRYFMTQRDRERVKRRAAQRPRDRAA